MVNDIAYLPEHISITPEILEQLSERAGCQRAILGNSGELLLVVHEVPESNSPERKALFFYRDKNSLWHASESHNGIKEFYGLLDRFAKAIDKNEAVMDDADTAREIFDILRHAGPLARSTRNLYLALEDANTKKGINDKDLRSLRDRTLELERAAELLYSDAKMALEFYRAERAEEQAESSEKLAKLSFRLNLLAGFFLPLVALGGLMGMNVELPMFVQKEFWWILITGLITGAFLLWLIARKVK
jgi:CorA-like Mg2+ transporter protein